MREPSIDSLTEKEIEVLRLVDRHLTSKEIAPILGIAPDSVDARIKRATRKLGFSERGKAAAYLAERETAYQRQVYPLPDVDPAHCYGTLAGPVGTSVREERMPFPLPISPVAEAQAPAPLEGGRKNRLGPWQRLGIIAAIAIGSILAVGAVISALNGLVQLALSRHLF